MDKAELGKKLKEARKKKGYTQERVAEMSDLSLSFIGEIERGKKMPSLNTFIKIIEAMNVSADYVLRNELSSGKEYVYDELTKKFESLTPKQRKAVSDIVDAYILNI